MHYCIESKHAALGDFQRFHCVVVGLVLSSHPSYTCCRHISMHHVCEFFPRSTADVRVYFDQSSYTVAEGEGELEVCVAIDKELGVPVHVNLFSQDSTAKGSKIAIGWG